MTTLFGAIADDFTGATDLAGLLARSGVPVSLRLGVPAEAADAPGPIEIIALKCRTSPVEQALAETREAYAWLRSAGASRFYWKYCSTFDSTPDGNIGPVAEMLLRELGANQTIYCPAFPENGRSVFMGNLFVGEQPLAESPMKDHPLTPMRDSNLMRLLAPQVDRAVGLVNRTVVAEGLIAVRQRLETLAAEGVAHVIIDAISEGDLATIARACQDMALLTGGSALARPLPEIWLEQGLLDKSRSHVQRKTGTDSSIILSGSCSAMTNRQVAHYLKTGQPAYRIDPLDISASGVDAVIQWLSKQDRNAVPLIYATAEPAAVREAQARLGAEGAGQLVEAALAECATAARDRGVRNFVVAGGETSGAVAKALGISTLGVGVEIAPGVPWCSARSAGHQVAIALKSGNFGRESFFTDALERLSS